MRKEFNEGTKLKQEKKNFGVVTMDRNDLMQNLDLMDEETLISYSGIWLMSLNLKICTR